jgi:hypothetical protein
MSKQLTKTTLLPKDNSVQMSIGQANLVHVTPLTVISDIPPPLELDVQKTAIL